MKKILAVFLTLIIFSVAVNAQSAEVSKADKAAEKEAKEKIKQKQNENIDNALAQVGVSKDVAKAFKSLSQSYSAKSSEVRKNTFLTDEEKEARLKSITDEKNAKLAELIGTDKYKEFSRIRKQQKESETATAVKD